MFPSSYYAKLDPSYRKALLQLENELYHKKAETFKPNNSSFNKICNFAERYLVPNKIWKKLWGNDLYAGNRMVILSRQTYHLAYTGKFKYDLHYYLIPKRKLLVKDSATEMRGHISRDIGIEDLCYPNNLLEFYLYYNEDNANSHLPRKIVNRNFEMRKLYEKIKNIEADENLEDWINAMKEADDEEFVKHNIEYKLGQDLTNKKLWILYIKYLKEYDTQELLQVYSKYCRFFVDDISMKEEYVKAAHKYGKATVPWKNAFDFEICDENLLKIEYPERPETSDLAGATHPNRSFTSEGALPQKFPFRPTVMKYIFKNANAAVLQKLNFSCKYFYSNYSIPICYYLFIASAGPTWNLYDFEEESLYLHSNTLEEIEIKKLYVTTKLYYQHYQKPLRNLIPKIYRCDAKFINIAGQELTIDEFKFFVGHGNVISLFLAHVKVFGYDSEALFLEDILALTPKLQYLTVYEAYCSPNTAQKLCEIPFKNKFMSIRLLNGTNIPLDPIAFGEFINKHASPDSRIIINGNGNVFEAGVNFLFLINFGRTVQNLLSLFMVIINSVVIRKSPGRSPVIIPELGGQKK